MKAIFKREFKSYFHNMTGPVFMAAIFVFMGIYFVAYNISQGYPYFAAALSSMSFILLIAVPILTMRSFAEERKTKTDQMLLTAPVTITQIVMGKYLSMLAIFGIVMGVSCAAPIIIHCYGGGALAADYAAIFAYFFLGAAYIAIGMFMSSITENQIIAAIGTFGILLILQLIEGIASLLSTSAAASYIAFIIVIALIALLIYALLKNAVIAGGLGIIAEIVLTVIFIVKKTSFESLFPNFLKAFSLVSRFDNVVNQTLDISTYIFYITIAGVFCFLTGQMIQKRRWS